jgi:hypothetical protein
MQNGGNSTTSTVPDLKLIHHPQILNNPALPLRGTEKRSIICTIVHRKNVIQSSIIGSPMCAGKEEMNPANPGLKGK